MERMSASRVAVIRAKGLPPGDVPAGTMRRMYEAGIRALTGERDPDTGLRRLFSPGDRVGIKVNSIGGKLLSTRPDVALPLASWLAERTVKPENVVVWDRTNRELKGAGYRLSSGGNGPRVFGTDTEGAGYGPELVVHRDIGSLFSSIQQDYVTASISLAVLKDHGLAGVTAGMKNYFGAIHNPNKYHDDRCDPFVAQVFDAPPIKSRHRLTVVDALSVQFHRGPSYHARWAAKPGTLLFSVDPVAADSVGWTLIERLRADAGLPTLEAEGRAPGYLATAEKMGLGRSAAAAIETIEETLS